MLVSGRPPHREHLSSVTWNGKRVIAEDFGTQAYMCSYICMCMWRKTAGNARVLCSTDPEERESVNQTSCHTVGFLGFWCQLKKYRNTDSLERWHTNTHIIPLNSFNVTFLHINIVTFSIYPKKTCAYNRVQKRKTSQKGKLETQVETDKVW